MINPGLGRFYIGPIRLLSYVQVYSDIPTDDFFSGCKESFPSLRCTLLFLLPSTSNLETKLFVD